MNFFLRNSKLCLTAPKRSWKIAALCRKFTKKHPYCAWCNKEKDLEAHHILPVWVAPDKALDETNLITLCSKCHFTFGHIGNFATRFLINIIELIESSQRFSSYISPDKKEKFKYIPKETLYDCYHNFNQE